MCLRRGAVRHPRHTQRGGIMTTAGPDQHDGTSRRRLLQAGVLGAGAAAFLPAASASASTSASAVADSSSQPDVDHPRFTLAVVPDTQYLFDSDRGDPAPLTA